MDDLDRLATLHVICPRCNRRAGRPCRYLSTTRKGESMWDRAHPQRRIAFRQLRRAQVHEVLQLKAWLAENAQLLIDGPQPVVEEKNDDYYERHTVSFTVDIRRGVDIEDVRSKLADAAESIDGVLVAWPVTNS